MANFIMGLISLTIGVVVLATVFITTIKGTNQTYVCPLNATANQQCGWTTGEIALWGLLALVGIAGMLYGVLNVFGIA